MKDNIDVNSFLYVTAEEKEQYKNNIEFLKSIEEERARDGIFSSDKINLARRSKYLYTTAEEEEKFRHNPEVLERIDMERACAHDGITYKTPWEVQRDIKQREENRKKRMEVIMESVNSALNPQYCLPEESAKLDKNNAILDSRFANFSQDLLVNSTFYRTGNSGKNGNNFIKISQALDSLNNHTNLVIKMIKKLKEEMAKDNYSDRNYNIYINSIIIFSMIIEKGYPIDKKIIKEEVGDFEFFMVDLISKVNFILSETDIHLGHNEKIVPNPVNFVSEVNGNEYIDIRNLGLQTISAYNSGHRLSDDRSKYKNGRIKYEIPVGAPTINDIPKEFIDKCMYTRIGGRYGHYTKFSSNMINKKTFIIDELTGVVSGIVSKKAGQETITIDSPTMDEFNEFNQKNVR